MMGQKRRIGDDCGPAASPRFSLSVDAQASAGSSPRAAVRRYIKSELAFHDPLPGFSSENGEELDYNRKHDDEEHDREDEEA